MSEGPMPFSENRVLEDAAFSRGLVPTRLHALLLPVWEVEIRADVTEAEGYQVIDRFLERGLRRGALHTVDELASFFGLQRGLVSQAIRFLTAISHVTETGGRLALTPLGKQSVDDDQRYVRTHEDRRKLYFDALSSSPLTKKHYDAQVVTLIPGEELDQLTRTDCFPRFHPLFAATGFDRSALDRLQAAEERERFNLPHAMERVESLGEELVHLPVYVVCGSTGILVYGQAGAGDAADPELTALCASAPEVIRAVEDAEGDRSSSDEKLRQSALRWLEKRGCTDVAPEQDEDGSWSVNLPATAFGDDERQLRHSRVGTFQMSGSRFFRLWCRDETPRKHALLARLDQRLGNRRAVPAEEAVELLHRLCRQLKLEPPTFARLRAGAKKKELWALEEQLARLEGE